MIVPRLRLDRIRTGRFGEMLNQSVAIEEPKPEQSAGKTRSRNLGRSFSTKKRSMAMSMEKENLERTHLLRSQALLNSSGQFLYDKTNLVGLPEVSPDICGCVYQNGLVGSTQKPDEGVKNGSFSSCSPFEGSNPLVWCKSTDSRMSRINSQRKRAQMLVQATHNGLLGYKLMSGAKSNPRKTDERGTVSSAGKAFYMRNEAARNRIRDVCSALERKVLSRGLAKWRNVAAAFLENAQSHFCKVLSRRY